MGYLDSLKRARQDRRHTTLPRFGWAVASLCVAVVAVYIALSIAIVPAGESSDHNFASERGTVTFLSSIYLALAAGSAGATAFVLRKRGRTGRIVWLLLAAGLAFFAVDELIQIHERIGIYLDDAGFPALGARHQNDLVVVAYGLLALAFGLYVLPTLLRLPRVVELFGIAFLLFAAHTFIDATHQPTSSFIVEESFKLLSVTFLVIATYTALLGATSPSPDAAPAATPSPTPRAGAPPPPAPARTRAPTAAPQSPPRIDPRSAAPPGNPPA